MKKILFWTSNESEFWIESNPKYLIKFLTLMIEKGECLKQSVKL